MPINPNIVGQSKVYPVADPVQILSDVLKVRSAEIKFREDQQAEADDRLARQTLGEFEGDFEKAGLTLIQRGNPTLGIRMQQVAQSQKKAFNDSLLESFKIHDAQVGEALKMVGAIADQTSLSAWRDTISKTNPELLPYVPEQYDTDTWEQHRDQLLSIGQSAQQQVQGNIALVGRIQTLQRDKVALAKASPDLVSSALSQAHNDELWQGARKALLMNDIDPSYLAPYGSAWSKAGQALAVKNAPAVRGTEQLSDRERYVFDNAGPNPSPSVRDTLLKRYTELTTRAPVGTAGGGLTAAGRNSAIQARLKDLRDIDNKFDAQALDERWVPHGTKPVPAEVAKRVAKQKQDVEDAFLAKTGGTRAPSAPVAATPAGNTGRKTTTKRMIELFVQDYNARNPNAPTTYEQELRRAQAANYDIK